MKLILLLLNTDPKTFAFVKLYEGLSKEDQRVVIKELKERLKAVKASYVPQEFAVVCQSLVLFDTAQPSACVYFI